MLAELFIINFVSGSGIVMAIKLLYPHSVDYTMYILIFIHKLIHSGYFKIVLTVKITIFVIVIIILF